MSVEQLCLGWRTTRRQPKGFRIERVGIFPITTGSAMQAMIRTGRAGINVDIK